MKSIIVLLHSAGFMDLCLRGLLCATVISLLTIIVARLIFKRAAASRHDLLLYGLLAVICSPVIVYAGRWLAFPRIEMIPISAKSLQIVRKQNLAADREVKVPLSQASSERSALGLTPLHQCDWRIVIALAWLTGSAGMTARLIGKAWTATRMRKSATSIPFSEPVAAIMPAGLPRGKPIVSFSPRIVSPVSFGFFRPLILIPERLPAILTKQQLRSVLWHEWAHILRGDHWVGLLQELVAIAFWPHPLVHILNHELSRAREEVCDNHALGVEDAAGYARALVTVAEWASERSGSRAALAIGLFCNSGRAPQKGLEHRILGLLDQKRNTMKRSNKFIVILATFLVCMASAILQLPALAKADAPAAHVTPASQANVPAAIRQMQAALNEVGVKFDQEKLASIFDRFTSKDFTLVGQDGLADKEAFMALVRWHNPDDVMTGLTVDDINVRMLGDTAIETGRYVLRSTQKNKIEYRRYTSVWTNQDGKWLIVHLQVSDPTPASDEPNNAKAGK